MAEGIKSHQSSVPRFLGQHLSDSQREGILKFADVILRGRGPFAQTVGERLEMTEVAVFEREEDGKTQMRMVFELDVTGGVCASVQVPAWSFSRLIGYNV